MKVVLTHEESENLFFDALCNGLGYVCSGYDLELDYNEELYNEVRQSGNCFEDVLMNILRGGGSLTLKDIGYDGEYTKTINLEDVHERVANTPITHLMDAINERGDCVTADVILQSVFFNEVVFG
jgi:hypothetical protein